MSILSCYTSQYWNKEADNKPAFKLAKSVLDDSKF